MGKKKTLKRIEEKLDKIVEEQQAVRNYLLNIRLEQMKPLATNNVMGVYSAPGYINIGWKPWE